MKKIILFLIAISLSMALFAQQESQRKPTKYEEFLSKTGVIVKFVDINLPKISTNLSSSIQTCIRIVQGSPNQYFYVLSKSDNGLLWDNFYSNGVAMIEYNDLVQVNKALDRIYSESETDLEMSPDYLKNVFITDDGFVVGHYVRKKQACSFMQLERHSDPIYIASYSKLVSAFKEAQAKIEELKANEGH